MKYLNYAIAIGVALIVGFYSTMVFTAINEIALGIEDLRVMNAVVRDLEANQ